VAGSRVPSRPPSESAGALGNPRLHSSAVEVSNLGGRQVLHSTPIVAMRLSLIYVSEDVANKQFVSAFRHRGSHIRKWILGVFLVLASGTNSMPAHLRQGHPPSVLLPDHWRACARLAVFQAVTQAQIQSRVRAAGMSRSHLDSAAPRSE